VDGTGGQLGAHRLEELEQTVETAELEELQDETHRLSAKRRLETVDQLESRLNVVVRLHERQLCLCRHNTLFKLAFHVADTDTDSDSPDTSRPIHPYVRYARFPREDARQKIACVGRKTVAVFGVSVSVSVSAPWNASFSPLGGMLAERAICFTSSLRCQRVYISVVVNQIITKFNERVG